MAKEDKGKVRMTVIHFETESDNETLQENIRAIAGTLARALTPSQRPTSIAPQLQSSASNPAVAAADEEDQVDVLDKDDVEISNPPSAPTKKPNRNSSLRTPLIVDADLTGDPKPLKVFLEETNPEGDIKRYLAIMYWFKKYRQLESVTMDHAYTGYRHMGWQVPADAAAPFRNMKQKQYGWVGSSGKGSYTINHIGENQVEKMVKSPSK